MQKKTPAAFKSFSTDTLKFIISEIFFVLDLFAFISKYPVL